MRMRFQRFLSVGALAALGAYVASPAMAGPTILNGSFEINASSIPAGGFTTVFAGDSTTIADWSVTQGSVDWVGTYWQAEQGIASIDLSGDGEGKITQTITGLTKGDEYQISFWLAGNPDGAPQRQDWDNQGHREWDRLQLCLSRDRPDSLKYGLGSGDLGFYGYGNDPTLLQFVEHHEFAVWAGHRQRRYNFYSGSVDLGDDDAWLRWPRISRAIARARAGNAALAA